MEFTEIVGQRLPPDEEAVKELWRPIAHEFDRDGPEAAVIYLNAQREQLEQHTRRLLNEFEERDC